MDKMDKLKIKLILFSSFLSCLAGAICSLIVSSDFIAVLTLKVKQTFCFVFCISPNANLAQSALELLSNMAHILCLAMR
jgi:hypothetical protein